MTLASLSQYIYHYSRSPLEHHLTDTEQSDFWFGQFSKSEMIYKSSTLPENTITGIELGQLPVLKLTLLVLEYRGITVNVLFDAHPGLLKYIKHAACSPKPLQPLYVPKPLSLGIFPTSPAYAVQRKTVTTAILAYLNLCRFSTLTGFAIPDSPDLQNWPLQRPNRCSSSAGIFHWDYRPLNHYA